MNHPSLIDNYRREESCEKVPLREKIERATPICEVDYSVQMEDSATVTHQFLPTAVSGPYVRTGGTGCVPNRNSVNQTRFIARFSRHTISSVAVFTHSVVSLN